MRSSLKILFYLRKNRLNKDGKASIMIRLTINSEMSQFAAKLDVEPELWDAKYGRVDGKTAYANRLNATLDNIKAALINRKHSVNCVFSLVKRLLTFVFKKEHVDVSNI